ncbi:CDGSH iron-sulfur domain-containing protein [Nocardia huaxiensis]|uniref:CDGSH iron-sulfur domain-containing protein n=1 Tax=Nocardia huaxiensis TaxID=2755382 RepID=A0A7D6YZT7_9NOCA|nr:CDGSH iron-sulfur domain-containing protein [Nocardia huaxiensis]QLY28766.1 CDGSH iron-sulfur domain-containing protein [Nocardia huaxiensis]UFS97761.1 CDGSH iron-sulfur domain-containing protein [Nocardia huaxiensis]
MPTDPGTDRRTITYTADGRIVRSDRCVVALCLCRRSARYPLCDTSHRKRRR